MPKPYRIAVLVDTSSGWGRRIIKGIANYSLKHGNWHLSVDETGINESMHLKAGWQGDGIIARVKDKKLYRELTASRKPIVNISGIELNGVTLPCVTTDRTATVELALEHFVERGFHNLAYYGPGKLTYVKKHAEAYKILTEQRGFPCNVFESKLKTNNYSREAEREELRAWVRDLPKPVGILTWGTLKGRDILTACSDEAISVPETVAVLAGDDDELLCEVCHPTLSGIVSPAAEVGYQAASIMDNLLHGREAPHDVIMIPPTEVNCRASTDTLAITDEKVSLALQFIRENADKAIDVNMVAHAAQTSRRSLERRFAECIGRSPAREIQKAHLRLAQKLLKETDMSIANIAAASGYGSTEYMIGVFKKSTGLTPQKYSAWVKAQ